jgi:hypothetical protein
MLFLEAEDPLIHSFHNGGNPLPYTDAHGREAVPVPAPFHLMN